LALHSVAVPAALAQNIRSFARRFTGEPLIPPFVWLV
jgi:hypothetical protein